MDDLKSFIDLLIEELRHIRKFNFWSEIEGDTNLLPSTIPIGHEKCIRSTSKFDRLVWQISSCLHREIKAEQKGFGSKDFQQAVRLSLGEIIASANLDDSDENIRASISRAIRTAVRQLDVSANKRTYVFGCDLFNCEVDRIALGPVLIRTRSSWLRNIINEGKIDQISAKRIEKVWSGAKPRKRKPALESEIEKEIIKLTVDHAYVCAVAADGFAENLGLERALLATNIALIAIAIHWQTPSDALRDFNIGFSSKMFHQKYLVFGDKGAVTCFSGKSQKPGGKYVERAVWIELHSAEEAFFAFYSKVLGWLLNQNFDAINSDVYDIFAQSTFWFHEACREKIPMISVVKFAASLDALVGGKGEIEIIKILEARAGVDRSEILFADGSTLKNSVELIYKTGISRIVHGTTDKFKYDWGLEKSKAEMIARICLLSCVDWAAKIDGPIDIKAMRA